MRLLHSLAKTHASFDDPNLVSHAGLVPVMALAQHAGLGDLVAAHVRPVGECGVNADVPGTTVPLVDAAPVRAPQAAGTSAGSGASRQATGSNSEASARSASSSSSPAAAAGSIPERGSTRPRYLITSARVHADLSCWASATAVCAARASSSPVNTTLPAPRMRGPAPRPWLCQTDGATEARRTPRVRASLSAQPACACARSSAPCFGLRVLKFDACARCASSRWDGARPYRCSNRAARPRRSALIDSRREENTRISWPEMPVISNPYPSPGGPFQAEPRGESLFQVLGDDRGDRADVLVVPERIRGPPFPVGRRPGDVGDLGMDVQLHVPVPGGVLQPVRHGQVGLVPLAGLLAAYAGAVAAGPGISGLALEVAEPGVHGGPDHLPQRQPGAYPDGSGRL